MKAFWKRYLNEIVGVAIMIVMTITLIDGEAHALADRHAGGADHTVIEILLTIGE